MVGLVPRSCAGQARCPGTCLIEARLCGFAGRASRTSYNTNPIPSKEIREPLWHSESFHEELWDLVQSEDLRRSILHRE